MSSSISLTHAVTSGDESAVKAILANGTDVNESTSGGQTALILAVIFGHTNLVELLVRAGADPHLRDNLGLNAIEWAHRRGSNEALDIFNAQPSRTTIKQVETALEQPPPPALKPTEPETRDTVSDDEKSRRWLAGLRQRLDEQEVRRLNRNEPPIIAKLEIPFEQKAAPVEPPKPTPKPDPVPEPVVETIAEPVAENPPPPVTTTTNRKRCPRCNAVYNGDLVSYCAHHIVPLVDIDEPIITEPPKTLPMFWIMVIITLTGSIVVGSLITTYLYKSNTAAARSAAQQTNIQKGLPEVSEELAGKVVSLPEAQCPVNGPEPVSGTVVVRVMVDKNGQVYWARGSGGDWLMRGASTEAAMKSTFAPDKLRGREIEGTITYSFKP